MTHDIGKSLQVYPQILGNPKQNEEKSRAQVKKRNLQKKIGNQNPDTPPGGGEPRFSLPFYTLPHKFRQ